MLFEQSSSCIYSILWRQRYNYYLNLIIKTGKNVCIITCGRFFCFLCLCVSVLNKNELGYGFSTEIQRAQGDTEK